MKVAYDDIWWVLVEFMMVSYVFIRFINYVIILFVWKSWNLDIYLDDI